ncbi:imbibition-inducible 1 [Arabidopsis lyrata subsp. lyrata]|uniref:Imbibition-inducible 1 n=2 Tax=Arabidopsis lyrata subsp. lyrata TaxID=81972 RepID=D7LHQ3_ARALL|nr:transcription factor GTE1 isoform X1 [Arabidopsis lyrata subsp. lyrata]EFH57623.1 imbibition-inducible 1 [Arabidopsis lyrata subsp. lyrata]|eukprot:XP_020885145.1 transcription factor GTE1 isoform X1 [Arabidopsis lyrata subsp. lyrata]
MSVHVKEEPVLVPNCDVENTELAVFYVNGETELEDFGTCVDEITDRVNQLEQKVVEVEHFYSSKDGAAQTNTSKSNSGGKKVAISQPNNSKCNSAGKEKSKGKHVSSPDLMRQFATMFRQIAQHKWAWPFLEPVDVKGLGLHDYYKVIEKPMDLGTIKKKMESSEYSNVREIYADVRLVFKNAMRYNEEKEDVYVMAESLLEKFEEKWLLIMPKLVEEEKKQADEEAEKHANKQLTLEAAQAEMARDLSNELYEIDLQLERLRESVVQRCRKLSTQEKKGLSAALGRLSPEDLSKALKMVSESNPSFPAGAPEVELDIDVQTDVTLWRLKVFVQEALKAANKGSGGTNAQNNNNTGTGEINKNNAKRRREISDAINKASTKRAKKA